MIEESTGEAGRNDDQMTRGGHPTGDDQAAANRELDPPA
jgi:hypothetical protein